MKAPFEPGQRVRHKVSGEKGTVLECKPANTKKHCYSMKVRTDRGVSFALSEMFEEV